MGDEEDVGIDQEMKKLSPSDPKIRYKIIIDIILRPDVIASKIIAKLKRKGLKNIEVIGRSLKITITSISREKLMQMLMLIKDELGDSDYEELCFQLYVMAPYDVYGDKISSLRAESVGKENGIEVKIVGYKDTKYWVYINSKKKKILIKKIKSKIVTAIIEPCLVSETLFITCTNSVEELRNQLEEDIKAYDDFLEKLTRELNTEKQEQL